MQFTRAIAILVTLSFATMAWTTLSFAVRAQNPTTIHLYGDAATGWGQSATSIQNPAPTLTIDASTKVTFLVHGVDTQPHTFYIDVNNNNQQDAGEGTDTFTGTGPTTYVANITAAGSYPYRCKIHPGTMVGTINVVGGSSGAMIAGLPLPVVLGIVIAIIVVLAIVAVVMMRRRGPPK